MADTNWLGVVIPTALGRAFAWKKAKDAGVKTEDGEHLTFADDGSNLRAQVVLPGVRLKLMKCQGRSCVLADDYTSVQALFTSEVRQDFESTFGRSIDTLVGHVIGLESFEIFATHLGATSARIRIVPSNITLPPASPAPTITAEAPRQITQRNDIKSFLSQLSQCRAAKATASPPSPPQASSSRHPPSSKSAASRLSPLPDTPAKAAWAPAEVSEPSDGEVIEISETTWRNHSLTPKKRPHASPSVSDRVVKARRHRSDENAIVQTGINLAPPVQIAQNKVLLDLLGKGSTSTTKTDPRRQVEQLLRQFGTMPPPPVPAAPVPSEAETHRSASADDLVSAIDDTQSQTLQMMTQVPLSVPHPEVEAAPRERFHEDLLSQPTGASTQASDQARIGRDAAAPLDNTPTSAQPQPVIESTQSNSQLETEPFPAHLDTAKPDASRATRLSLSSSSHVLDSSSSIHPFGRAPSLLYAKYARRPIPGNQKKLINRTDSWLPSKPGSLFPHPNLPISLLERLDGGAQQSANARPVTPPAATRAETGDDGDSDSGASIPWSPSPPRRDPPHFRLDTRRRTTNLPPDSSAEDPRDELMLDVPSSPPASPTPGDSDDFLEFGPDAPSKANDLIRQRATDTTERTNLRELPEFSLSSPVDTTIDARSQPDFEDVRHSHDKSGLHGAIVKDTSSANTGANACASGAQETGEVRRANAQGTGEVQMTDTPREEDDPVPRLPSSTSSKRSVARPVSNYPEESSLPGNKSAFSAEAEVEVVETPARSKPMIKKHRRRFGWTPPPQENPQALWAKNRREILPRGEKKTLLTEHNLDDGTSAVDQGPRSTRDAYAVVTSGSQGAIMQHEDSVALDGGIPTLNQPDKYQQREQQISQDKTSLTEKSLDDREAIDADTPSGSQASVHLSERPKLAHNSNDAAAGPRHEMPVEARTEPGSIIPIKDSDKAGLRAESTPGSRHELTGFGKPSELLSIGNLPSKVDDEELYRLFEKFDPLSAVVVKDRVNGLSPGSGFVNFDRVDSAIEALMARHDGVIDGMHIKCEFAIPSEIPILPMFHKKLGPDVISTGTSRVEHGELVSLRQVLVEQRHYNGSAKAFTNMCSKLHRLHRSATVDSISPSHWDDYVVLQTKHYTPYVQSAAANGEDILSYDLYWRAELEPNLHVNKNPVLTPARLDAIFDARSDWSRASFSSASLPSPVVVSSSRHASSQGAQIRNGDRGPTTESHTAYPQRLSGTAPGSHHDSPDDPGRTKSYAGSRQDSEISNVGSPSTAQISFPTDPSLSVVRTQNPESVTPRGSPRQALGSEDLQRAAHQRRAETRNSQNAATTPSPQQVLKHIESATCPTRRVSRHRGMDKTARVLHTLDVGDRPERNAGEPTRGFEEFVRGYLALGKGLNRRKNAWAAEEEEEEEAEERTTKAKVNVLAWDL